MVFVLFIPSVHTLCSPHFTPFPLRLQEADMEEKRYSKYITHTVKDHNLELARLKNGVSLLNKPYPDPDTNFGSYAWL